MDIDKLSNNGPDHVTALSGNSLPVEEKSAGPSEENKSSSRPIPEITASIIRDMDKLCDWLHKVQKLHLQITQMRQQRMEDEIAARWAQIHEQDRVLMSSNDRV